MERKNTQEPSDNQGTSPVYSFLRIASTFGITLAMNIYLLSVLLGGWLDAKYDTSVLFRLIFLFIALISSFFYLWKRVVSSEKVERELRAQAQQEAAEREALEAKKEQLRRGLK